MPFELSPMLEEDIPEFGIVDELAMANVPLARAMDEPGVPRRVMAEKFTRKEWGKVPGHQWMKVTDSETGAMVAAALWSFDLVGAKSGPKAPAPVEGEGDKEKVKEAMKKEETGEKKKDEKPSIFAELGRNWQSFKEDFVGDQPFGFLNVIVTRPDYQRQGAASMLVKWGCDKADEHGLKCALTATSDGVHVYTKFGFEIVRVREIDLRPYGVDATEVRRGMLRTPKTTTG